MWRACQAGLFCAIAACLLVSPHAQAQTQRLHAQRLHALSLFGAPALAEGFAHFPYVRADAPKGGELRLAALGGFDSLNPFILRGDVAPGINLLYDTLMVDSLGEPSTSYGLIASHVSYPPDFSSATFYLRPEARFADGSPITAEDVAWSMEIIKAHHPFYRAYWRDVVSSDILGPHRIRFNFATTGNRELPLIVTQLPILPKQYWADKPFDKTTLTPPLGSGPYRIASVEAGRHIIYERVRDHWARNLPVRKGYHNFDTIRYISFGDANIAFEALKAGEVEFRLENHSRNWAEGYDIAAVQEQKLRKRTIAHKQGTGMQGFVMNIRRAQFADRATRRALNLAFDFEWSNRNLFYGQYTRSNSYFSNSELAAHALPSQDELALLRPFRAQLPPEIFTKAWRNPTTTPPQTLRQNLRDATKLLTQAGWRLKGDTLERNGRKFYIEFLLFDSTYERILAPYQRNLKRLGIASRIRRVDSSQYQNRIRDYDFDIVVGNFPQSLSPGNEQLDFWGSASARQKGGRNIIGIQDPVVDALIEHVIYAPDRAALITATRALDRVLLWGDYVVPHWYIPYFRVAHWQQLRHPEPLPAYHHGMPYIWWHAP